MSTENLPATRAQLQAMRDLSIPFDLDHLPTFDDAARLIREAEEAENPMRVAMGPPVRDIREAMHPPRELPWREQAAAMGIPGATAEQFLAAAAERAAHPLQTLLGGPHVAALPDGTRVNLPAGTVLREGTADVLTPLQVLCNIGETLTALGYGLAPVLDTVKAIVAQNKAARDLLQRARIRLVDEPDAKKLDAEIAAFLAGASPPEHPLFALVRSFVGKPGDKPGPAWTALMCVQARLDDDDLDGAKAAATALEEALNERLGQMHDALGRDTTEERTL